MPGVTDPKHYTIELGQQRCLEILQECLEVKDKNGKSLIENDPVTGCTLYLGKLTGDGHWQIQRRPRYYTRASNRTTKINQHRAYYVHRIAYVARHGCDPVHTASHLCGRGNCFNSRHIFDEPIDVNVLRINCLGTVVCRLHNHVLATLCTHSPPCIKTPIYVDQCCLSLSVNPGAQPQAPPVAVPSSPPHPPSSGGWLLSSQTNFDTMAEELSSNATPPPSSTAPVPPIEPPSSPPVASPPAWVPQDLEGESQQSSGSEYLEISD